VIAPATIHLAKERVIPRPPQEEARVLSLRSLRLLDTPPEERFDRIVRLAAKIFGVPIAYISLVEEDRQWLKARQGLCQVETSREQSFCGYAILQEGIMVVADAQMDSRFKDNPMVTGEPYVRFYAGRPLRSLEGYNVGSLCLMGKNPRTLDESEQELLHQLAELVEHEFHLLDVVQAQSLLLKSQQELAEEKKKTDSLLRNILPEHVALELKKSGRVEAMLHEQVCVMFTDFTNFTSVSAEMDPQELVQELNACFTAFDQIAERFGVEKLKTIGDGYLCVSGLLKKGECPAGSLFQAAVAMREFIQERRRAKEKEGTAYWDLRIGLHVGSVVAGVVGMHKFAYDIWGDTVNIAARLETAGEPGKINVSLDFANYVKGRVKLIERGSLPIKGKPDMEMFYVEPDQPRGAASAQGC
jgi:adenylate cyclase